VASPDGIFALPVTLQVALGAGYLAYIVAFAGLRRHHTSADAVFGSIAFGLIATAVLSFCTLSGPLNYLLASLLTLVCGVFWRWRGGSWANQLLRRIGVSWADGLPTAWLSVTAVRSDFPLSQIAVEMDDGRIVVCDDTRPFGKSPHGPCVLGLDGSVAMYVTGEMRPDKSWFEPSDIENLDGARLTFIPADKVRRVELRYWTKTIGSGAKVVEPATDEAEE
jgi:hypothetical protein